MAGGNEVSVPADQPIHATQITVVGPVVSRGVSLDSISQLPISPVNCPRSLRIDNEVAQLAVIGEAFIVKAPRICRVCRHL